MTQLPSWWIVFVSQAMIPGLQLPWKMPKEEITQCRSRPLNMLFSVVPHQHWRRSFLCTFPFGWEVPRQRLVPITSHGLTIQSKSTTLTIQCGRTGPIMDWQPLCSFGALLCCGNRPRFDVKQYCLSNRSNWPGIFGIYWEDTLWVHWQVLCRINFTRL